jgi:hypothetical protein
MIYELRIYRCVPGRLTEKDGQHLENISSQLLAPTAFSGVK